MRLGIKKNRYVCTWKFVVRHSDVMVTSNCQADDDSMERYLFMFIRKYLTLWHLTVSSLTLQREWSTSYGRNGPQRPCGGIAVFERSTPFQVKISAWLRNVISATIKFQFWALQSACTPRNFCDDRKQFLRKRTSKWTTGPSLTPVGKLRLRKATCFGENERPTVTADDRFHQTWLPNNVQGVAAAELKVCNSLF